MDASAHLQRLQLLMAQRDALEAEAEAVRSELEAPGPEGQAAPGLRGPLVDAEGFPRADIDLYNVRAKRNRIACINTDYRAIMVEIEAELKNLHASTPMPAPPAPRAASTAVGAPNISVTTGSDDNDQAELSYLDTPGFALIDEVTEGSPAASAGLCVGDVLVSFGGLRVQSSALGLGSSPMPSIPRVVQENVNRQVQIVVRRRKRGGNVPTAPSPEVDGVAAGLQGAALADASKRGNVIDDIVHISLVPRVWSGRGLLGCHLTPMS